MVDRILDAAETDEVGDIAGGADDEEISEAVIENQFGSDAAVRAGEHDDVRLLSRGELTAQRNHVIGVGFAGDEALIAGKKVGPEFVSGGFGGCRCVMVRRRRGGLLRKSQVGDR